MIPYRPAQLLPITKHSSVPAFPITTCPIVGKSDISDITYDTFQLALAEGGRPDDFFSKMLCRIFGVTDEHFAKAAEISRIKDAALLREAEAIKEVQSKVIETLILPVYPEPDPYLELNHQRFQQQIEFLQSKRVDIEFTHTREVGPFDEIMHYTFAKAKLSVRHDKIAGLYTVEGRFFDIDPVILINFRAFIRVLNEKGICSLSDIPKLDEAGLTVHWQTKNPDEAGDILTILGDLYWTKDGIWCGEMLNYYDPFIHILPTKPDSPYAFEKYGYDISPHLNSVLLWHSEWAESLVNALTDMSGLSSEHKIAAIDYCSSQYPSFGQCYSHALVEEVTNIYFGLESESDFRDVALRVLTGKFYNKLDLETIEKIVIREIDVKRDYKKQEKLFLNSLYLLLLEKSGEKGCPLIIPYIDNFFHEIESSPVEIKYRKLIEIEDLEEADHYFYHVMCQNYSIWELIKHVKMHNEALGTAYEAKFEKLLPIFAERLKTGKYF